MGGGIGLITLNRLTKDDIGRKVVYEPFRHCDTSLLEEGVITSFNDTYVYVRYGSDVHSKATRANDLVFWVL